MANLKAPFPWFGGKSKAWAEVSAAMGDVKTYCEPFAGSLGVLLQRDAVNHEVVNDNDGWLCNFWRAIAKDPEGVACHADWPVNELDLTARHAWLLARGPTLKATMEADPDAYDVQAAGWWVWGICSWIGSGWCTGNGPWNVADTDDGPRIVNIRGDAGRGINRQLPHMGDAGQGINRKLPHMSAGRGIAEWFDALAQRLRRVRVACGDFERVLSNSVLHLRQGGGGPAGVLLDPPYPAGFDSHGCYAGSTEHAESVFGRAVQWAVENANRPELRIVVCGYDGMWQPPEGWTTRQWKNNAGYRREAGQRQEVLWCSPHCITPEKADD